MKSRLAFGENPQKNVSLFFKSPHCEEGESKGELFFFCLVVLFFGIPSTLYQ